MIIFVLTFRKITSLSLFQLYRESDSIVHVERG